MSNQTSSCFYQRCAPIGSGSFKGSNCSPSDDCIELDHYPAMAQGNHGTCWRMAATNVLRHAISQQKGICIDQVSPFSFSNHDKKLNFAIKRKCHIVEREGCMDGYRDENNRPLPKLI